MEEADEVEFEDDDTLMEPETTTSQARETGSKAPARDEAGRRLKGRGTASGALATMQETGRYDSIETKGGSSRGPAKCTRIPQR
jgi:hypothetical protein